MALLPAPLNRRVRHVLEENKRVEDAVTALHHANMPTLARLLNASHASLRDPYEVSAPELEDTVTTLKAAGAAGARLSVTASAARSSPCSRPQVPIPPNATRVTPGGPEQLIPTTAEHVTVEHL